MRCRLFVPLLSFGLCFASLSAHASAISGDQFSYVLQYGNGVYDQAPNFTAYGSATTSNYPIKVSVSATQITFNFNFNSSFSGGNFNGPILTDLTENLPFSSLTLDAGTTVPGYAASDASVSGNAISFNFAGNQIVNGGQVVFDYAGAAATPEPSSLVLLGTGLLGAVGAARRRFRV